jgi:hypothetical protein
VSDKVIVESVEASQANINRQTLAAAFVCCWKYEQITGEDLAQYPS